MAKPRVVWMGSYERLDEQGNVIERVTALENSFEDNRLGLEAQKKGAVWRTTDPEPAASGPVEAKPEPPKTPKPAKARPAKAKKG